MMSPFCALKRVTLSERLPRVDTISPPLQERIRDRDRLIEQPAGIVAQIEHRTEHLIAALFPQIAQNSIEIVGRVLGERRDSRENDVLVQHLRAHRTDLDDRARDGEPEGLLHPAAADSESDLGVGGAPHLVDRLLEGEPEHRLVVEMGHQVARLDAGALRGRVVDRRDHLDEAVLHRHFDAEAAELAPRLNLNFFVALGVVVFRVRVERSDHPLDGGVDQIGRAHLLDVIVANTLKDVAEQVELIVSFPVLLGERERRKGNDHQAGDADRD